MRTRHEFGIRAATLAVAAALGGVPATGVAAAAAAEVQELEEVTVTGSRIRRNGFDAPQPLTVVDIAQMERLAQVNVAEVLDSLPQNIAAQSETNAGVFPTANVGSNFANLRGLNPVAGTRTLTLVDGRRFVPTSDGGAVDLNVIPSALIGRIESVTGGASAAYGSDAVGGVVNVILDSSFTGIKAQYDVGRTFRGDGQEQHLSFGAGTGFAGGRGHVVVGAEWQDNDGIGDCAEVRTWCAEGYDVYTNNGLLDPDATPQRTSPAAAPAPRNRRYLGQPNYIIGPGSRQAFNVSTGAIRNLPPGPYIPVPELYNKRFNEDGTAILDMDPGKYVSNFAIFARMGGDGDSTYADSAIRVPLERYSVFTHGSWDFADSLQGVAELTYAGRKVAVSQQIAGPRSSMWIFHDNAFLPQEVRDLMPPGSAFSLGKDMDETFSGINRSEVNTLRALVGLSGRLPGSSWTWDAYYQYGRNEREQTYSHTRVNHFFTYALDAVDEGEFNGGPPNGNIQCRAVLQGIAAAAGCVPLNLFGLNNITREAVDYAYDEAPEDFRYEQHVVAATVSGELWRGFGAGPVSAAFGVEYRGEDGDVTHGDIPYYNQLAFTFGQDFGGTIDVVEGFAEVNAPLAAGRPWAKQLELNGAVRQTQNKSHDKDPNGVLPPGTDRTKSVNFTSWKLSALWDVTDWLRSRATRSRDMRAAGFRELFFKAVPTEEGTAQGRVNNPFNGNAIDGTPILSAGNFGLTPEKADTWTVGLVLTPGGIAQGLRLSADWYEIRIKDAVASTGAQQIVDFCFQGLGFCDRITFSDDTRTNITFIQAGQVNLGRFVSRGMDIELDYTLPLSRLGGRARGTLNLRSMATVNYDLRFQGAPGAGFIDYAGQTGVSAFADFVNGPKWQLNNWLTYTLDRFSTTLSVRHIPSAKFNVLWIGPDDPRYDDLIAASMSDLTSAVPLNTISDNTVASRTYVGLSANYKVPFGNAGGSWEVFGTINNLFDKDPPFAAGGIIGPGTNYPTNPVYFDTLGAWFRAGVRVRF